MPAETYTITNGHFTINLEELAREIAPHLVADNDNTEQVLGVNEVEEMIDNSLNEHDFSMAIEDIISYNYDFVTECDVSDIVRDYCDGEEFLRIDDIPDVSTLESTVRRFEERIMAMQAELDFLHEKHVENVERRLTERIRRAVEAVRSVPGRVWARVPRFTIVRKAN